MQDVAMQLGLPVDGKAVCGSIDPRGWRDVAAAVIGLRPPETAQDGKDKRTTGIASGWFSEHFRRCPPDADEAQVERYAKAWLWHLLGGFLFPDGSGNTISWMMLPIIRMDWEEIGTYSWASATLAWLYRALCDACTRVGENSNLGGCAYLLQLWMWERFPIARPERNNLQVIELSSSMLDIVSFLIISLLHVS